MSEVDSEQYQRGYQNAIDDFQRNLKLRSRDVPINKGRDNENQPSNNKNNTEENKNKMMYRKFQKINKKSQKKSDNQHL